MADTTYEIQDPEGNPVSVIVRRDKRLKKSARWQPQSDGSILLRVPRRMPRFAFRNLLNDIEGQLNTIKVKTKGRTDSDLQERANKINQKFFKGEINWEAIRWVNNMKTRLGSCTNGGPTDGHIRISRRIKDWPDWVVDYVIAHELCHRLHPNHSKAFWHTLSQAYPLTEKAKGFITGVGFAKSITWEED